MPLSRHSVGTLSGNELTRNTSRNTRSQSSQLAETPWTNSGMKPSPPPQTFSPVQTAYRPHHSTETALVNIENELFHTLEDGKASILTLLDLSAAFDLIDHNVLLHRVEHAFGFKGVDLSWSPSYLSDRDQTVVVTGQKLESYRLLYGVPQGVVRGPILFVLYKHTHTQKQQQQQ